MALSPGLLLIVGAVLVPLLPGWPRRVWMALLPLGGMAMLWLLPAGFSVELQLFGLTLQPVRVDALGRVFATGFLIAALLTSIYAMHLRDRLQQMIVPMYAGTAVGGVLAGDLISMFVFWELAGLSSVFLILAGGTGKAYRASMRYLAIQVVSGLLLLAGIVIRLQAGAGISFDHIGLDGPGGWAILLAFGIKCAFPLLHGWLIDAYPEATVVGTVALSAFTTKFAVYALARGFAGTEALIWVGALMAIFPIFYAVIENDLRRVLSYSMINQLGFMVAGIGIGGALGVNGAAAHAVADMVFKGLLMMSMGAVLLRTGTVNGSELGGLYKSMPQTTVLCMIGAASISAAPLFSGFATKTIIMTAVAEEHHTVIWLMLLFASAGVFHHAGIKIPFFAFFAHDRGWRVREAPLNMRIAMGLAAIVCITIGVVPSLLYGMLPFAMDYTPYDTAHVINQLQLLLLASMAFTVLMRTGLYPPELRSVNVDVDVVYRKVLPAGWRGVTALATRVQTAAAGPLQRTLDAGRGLAARTLGPTAPVATPWSTHVMVWCVVLIFGLTLLLSLI